MCVLHKVWAFVTADPWLTAAAVAQIVLVIAGAVVTLHEVWAKRHRLPLLLTFAAAGLVGLVATVNQGVRSGESDAKLSASLDNLGKAASEITRMTTLNTALQQKVLDQGKTISDLAKKSIDVTTGADSYAYVEISGVGQANLVTVIHSGAYPLHSLGMRITDLQKLNELERQHVPLTYDNFIARDNIYSVGDLASKSARILGTLNITPSNEHDFNIFFWANNGMWTELLRYRLVDGEWQFAYRILRSKTQDGKNEVSIKDFSTPKFPKVNGIVDWKAMQQQ